MSEKEYSWSVKLDWLNILNKLGLESIKQISEFKKDKAIRKLTRTFGNEALLEREGDELDKLVVQELKELMRKEHQKGMIKNSVGWFSYLMTNELMKHLARPGWKHETIAYLEDRLGEEIAELCDAIESNQPKDVVEKEAADVANFLMMIADIYRQKTAKKK